MKKIVLAAAAALVLASCGPKSFTFVQLSDPQVGFMDKTDDYSYSDSLMKQAVKVVNRVRPEAVIITGDLVNDAQDLRQKYVYTNNIESINRNIPVYALPGNHDMRPWTRSNHEMFVEFNGYDRFSFKLNDCAFIGFDSCCIKDGIEDQEADQLIWLVDELKAAQGSRYIFLFTHCPIFRESIDENEDYFNFSKPKRTEYLELGRHQAHHRRHCGHATRRWRIRPQHRSRWPQEFHQHLQRFRGKIAYGSAEHQQNQ